MSFIIKEIIGILNLSIPLVIAYLLAPESVLSYWGKIIWAIIIGLWIVYINYQAGTAFTRSGARIDNPACMQMLQEEVRRCNLNPDDVCLQYKYIDDAVGMAAFNTVMIDPMLWTDKEIEDDKLAQDIRIIFERCTLPSIDQHKRELHARIKESLSSDARRFIFRHELGHIAYDYSRKKIMLIGAIMTCAAYSGLTVAGLALAPLGGIAALLLGMTTGGIIDVALSFASNIVFKAAEEKKADLFAAQHSSPQEIEAAAQFFENYEQHAHAYKKAAGLSTLIPGIVLSGHPSGQTRATYLRMLTK